MMIKVRHIAIMVSNLEKSLEFYRDRLGLSQVRTLEVYNNEAADLTDGETNIRLILTNQDSPTSKNPERPVGFNHIGFIVEDLEATCQKLHEAGVQFLSKAPADFFKISDPDGLVIDITSSARGW